MKNTREFDFLRTLALNLGATEARVIPAEEIVVENRVVLKCRVGCDDYGKKLTCPPFTPKVDEFRAVYARNATCKLESASIRRWLVVQNTPSE